MLNCNAVTAETSANLTGSYEVGLIHQKHLQLKHGLVIGFRLDLGRGCNLGEDSPLWPSTIPKEALNSKELFGPGEPGSSSQWECAVHHHRTYAHQHKVKEAKER